MRARLRLRGRREDRFGQGIRFAQTGRQVDPADRAGLPVLSPSRSGEEAPHHAFHRKDVELPHEHRSAGELVWDLGGEKMVWHEVIRALEPEGRKAREDLPLVGDQGGQDDVVGRDAI